MSNKKVTHNCPKCGMNLIETAFCKPTCYEPDCGGIILTNKTLKEFQNKALMKEEALKKYPLTPEQCFKQKEEPNFGNSLDTTLSTICLAGDLFSKGEGIIDKVEQEQLLKEIIQEDENLGLYNVSKKETLDEAADRNYKEAGLNAYFKNGFIRGANWQAERSYSEEEVLTIISDIVEKYCTYFKQKDKDAAKLELFEKFKKK